MTPDLTTTNILLGIMAAVALLEAFAVIGGMLAGFLVYRRVMQVVDRIEERQVAPAVARVNAILDDVKGVTSSVRGKSDRVDRLIDWIVGSCCGQRHHAGDERSGRVM